MSGSETKSLRRENLELMLLRKKECTAKALQCVETLIELNVLEPTLRRTLPHINQSTYQDVVDERSITYVCGYPLCSSKLKNIPKKQYSIVRCNGQLTLFDTAERKKFCSNICYKASKFLFDQLPSSPLWLIETKETDAFTLIPLNSNISRCSYGEEIQMNVERPATVKNDESSLKRASDENESYTSNLEIATNDSTGRSKLDNQSTSNTEELFFDSCSSLDGDHVNAETQKHEFDSQSSVVGDLANHKTLPTKDQSSTFNEQPFSEKSDKVIESWDKKIEGTINNQASQINTNIRTEGNLNHVISSNREVNDVKGTLGAESHEVTNVGNQKEKVESKKMKKKKQNKEKHEEHPDKSPVLAAVLNTEQKIREWVSVETLNFIFGSEKLRNILEEHGLLDKLQEKNIDSARDPYLFERYIEICTKLNILDLKDSKFDKEVREESAIPTKPLPDFKKLREEAKEMELKVRSFYAGDKRVQFSNAIIEESEAKDEKPNVLPLVDQHAQHAFRRRIVLDHLNKV